MPESWLAADRPLPSGVIAGVSLRAGGASAGRWQGRNVGLAVGDDPAAVAANRAELVAAIRPRGVPLWLEQVHGTEIVDADGLAAGVVPVADGAVTRRGRCLTIQTADCLPLLIAARDGSVLGAAHGGWRGLAGGIVEKLLAAMGPAPAALVAWLGPAISAANYEVDDIVRDAFAAAPLPLTHRFTTVRPGHYRCDLAGIATDILADAGVGDVRNSGLCTFADAERFYSYRRDGQTGRQVSFIAACEGSAAP